MDRDDHKGRPQDEENGADNAEPYEGSDQENPQGTDQDPAYSSAEGGDWQDQPVDDFTDEAQTAEATYAEDVNPEDRPPGEQAPATGEDGPVEDEYYQRLPEEGEAVAEGEEMAAPEDMDTVQKPGSSLMGYMPYVAGTVILLILGFFGFQQFSGSFSSAPSQPGPVEVVADTPPTPLPPQVAENTLPLPPQPAPMPDVNAVNPSPDVLAPPPPDQRLPANAPSVITSNTPLPSPATGSAQTQTELENHIVELNKQIEDLKASQAQLKQQLDTATAAASQLPQANSEQAAAATHALEQRIAELEQRLQTQAAASTPAPAATPSTPTATTPSSSDTNVLSPASTDTKPATPKRKKARKKSTDFMANQLQREVNAHHRSGRLVVPPDESVPPMAAPLPTMPSAAGWVLRSAQPGSAWISQGMSPNLRRIVPGDKVPGIGTIVSIHQYAGRWVIEGTQGTIH
jgi:hypothetical protein